jgi:IS5 family transposase
VNHEVFKAQQVFDFVQPDWSKSLELYLVHQILNYFPDIFEVAASCFPNLDQNNYIGRTGMTLEQVVRCAIYKQKKRLTYRELSVHSYDSKMGIVFMKIDDGTGFKFQTLQENVSKITDDILYEINIVICKLAMELDVDDGKKMRTDSTAIQSNIHYPTNCSLLWDCIRVCGRILKKASHLFNEIKVTNYQKSAKKLNYQIVNTNSQEKRIPLFKKMLRKQNRHIELAEFAIAYLSELKVTNPIIEKERTNYLLQLQQLLPNMKKIYHVAYRKEILNEEIPIEEKIFSIFETHTDCITKGKRKSVFGHKVNFTSGKSNLIFDVIMERGNPNDKDYFPQTLHNVKQNYNLVPRDFATDGGYASFKNLTDAKQLGVKNIVFTNFILKKFHFFIGLQTDTNYFI